LGKSKHGFPDAGSRRGFRAIVSRNKPSRLERRSPFPDEPPIFQVAPFAVRWLMLCGMALKLYGHDTSPYVRRVRVLLAEKGLPFIRDTDSWSVENAEVLRLNPILRVPALVDTAVPGAEPQQLLDSKLIATYLYDRYPGAPPACSPPLQTTLFHPAHRYDDDNILQCIDVAADSAINVFLLERDGISRDKAPYLLRQVERTERCLTWVEERLGGRSTFHEGVFSFLDIALTCALDWFLFRDRYPVHKHPQFTRFLQTHAERPSLAATHPKMAESSAMPQLNPPKPKKSA
jgi:glutathione S-transferase